MKRSSLWTFLYIAPLLVVSAVRLTAADTPPIPPTLSGGSLSSATAPALLSVARVDLKLGLKEQILAAVQVQIDGKRFPNLDHRAHETAEKLAKILADAATEADKKFTALPDKGGQDTKEFRDQVALKIDTLLKERQGRELDWRWIVVAATNIERKHLQDSIKTIPNATPETDGVMPNSTRWSHLSYVYQEYAQATAILANNLKKQRQAEDELMAQAMARGGFSMGNANAGGWVTTPGSTDSRRRRWFICR